MKALILAGGFGTRLKSISGDLPKGMVSVAGRPILEHQIEGLRKQGIEKVVLATHYGADKIADHFGKGGSFGVDIDYSYEDEPLGTGGAVRNAQSFLENEEFFVLNGDSFANLSLEDLVNDHKSKNVVASIAVTEVDQKQEQHYGSVEISKAGLITSFNEKTNRGSGKINSGVYLFSPRIFESMPAKPSFSLEKEIFPDLVRKKELSAFSFEGGFIDIGRPETYEEFKRQKMGEICLAPHRNMLDAFRIMKENKTPFICVVDEEGNLKGVLTEKVVSDFITQKGNLGDSIEGKYFTRPKFTATISEPQQEIERKLKHTRHLPILDDSGKLFNIIYRADRPTINSGVQQVSGFSPLRISFAGGGSDMPDFYTKYGGAVTSTTIDRYCRVTASKRPDRRVIIDLQDKNYTFSLDDLTNTGDTGVDIFKGILRITKPDFGIKLTVTNDLPPGRGLGSSASFCGLLAQTIATLNGRPYSRQECAEIAFAAETTEAGIKGGKQDQYAANFGGFNWIEFNPGEKGIGVYPLRLDGDREDRLHSHLTLFYTGREHSSQDQHSEQEKKRKESEDEARERLTKMSDYSRDWRDLLVSANPSFERMGNILHECWEIKRSLSGKVSNGRIDQLYEAGRESGAYGGKLLGSGGGGYLLFMHSPKNKNELIRNLEKLNAEYTPFNFEKKGTTVWIQ